MSRIVAYVPDLMDRSRLTSAGYDVRFVSSTDALVEAAGAEGVDVVVVDLDRFRLADRLPEVVAAAAVARAKVVAFGSHVDRDRFDAARAAGIDDVVARSVMFGRTAELLG